MPQTATYNAAANVVGGSAQPVTSLTPGATVTVLGFLASGSCEAQFTLTVGGTTILSQRSSAQDRNVYVLLPISPAAYTTSVAIVINALHDEAANQSFEATILTA